jgi:hypothetical protein
MLALGTSQASADVRVAFEIRHSHSVLSHRAPLVGHRRGRDLPDGRAVENPVQWASQKYFASQLARNTFMDSDVPPQSEGRFAIVTNVGQGCGGRGSVLRARGSQGG